MDNFNLDELMDLAEAYVGPMVDAIYRRLIERDFALEDPEVVMLLTALINILGHDNRGDRPTEVLLMAAYGERGVLDRPNMRVMRWRNGALSGSDLANEPGLGSSRTYQPGEMPMPSKPKPGLTRMHREMNSEATSAGSPLRAAVPPKRAKVTQKVQTNQTIQDLDEMNDQLRSTKKELDDMTKTMLAIRWLEAHVRENNRQEAPTREQLQKLDCLKDLDLFETMCKVLNIPMEVKKIWARKRLMPWFRANMTAWLYEYAKKHMSKHGRVYSEYQLDIGAGAFKRAFVTHRNAVTTAVKRISRTSERSGNEKAEMLKEDLERNVTLCLHNSFCRNRESNVDPLPCCKQRVEEQKCWRTASNSVRIVNDVLQDTETESAESVSQEEEMEH